MSGKRQVEVSIGAGEVVLFEFPDRVPSAPIKQVPSRQPLNAAQHGLAAHRMHQEQDADQSFRVQLGAEQWMVSEQFRTRSDQKNASSGEVLNREHASQIGAHYQSPVS